MRIAFLLLPLVGCAGGLADPPDTGPVPACGLAEESRVCPECSDGPWTCIFGERSVTSGACGGCQTRADLYAALCDLGDPASEGEIIGSTECHACRTIVDPCGDPCVPVCAEAGTVPPTTCTAECTSTVQDPAGPCVWSGSECAFQ